MENCRQELDDIIRERRIRSVFQPIVSLRDGNIFGFEALSRITGQTGIFTRQTGRCHRHAGGEHRFLYSQIQSAEKSFVQPQRTEIFRRKYQYSGRNGFCRDASGGGKGTSGRQSSRVSSAAMILQRFTENAAVKMSAGEL